MRKALFTGWLLTAMIVLAAWPNSLRAQGGFELIAGKMFDGAVPDRFYLETNAIPVQKRNAAYLKSPAGTYFLTALLDTSGYSSQVRQKYEGMVISEGKVSICGKPVAVGSYGFGLARPTPPSNADATFYLYDQAGAKVAECAAKKDSEIKLPRPLRVVLGKDGTARLYLGRYWLELIR